jgi:anti-sigma-K factor RskA
MTPDEDIEGLAAEYVLGSLDASERSEVDRRRRHDADLDAAVLAWEKRLAPLADRLPGIEPPPHLLQATLDRIASRGSNVVPLADAQRAKPRARLAIAISALAACLVLFVSWLTYSYVAQPQVLVANLYQHNADAPDGQRTIAFVVTVDIPGRSILVRPVSARARQGRTYQLWLQRVGATAPMLLGAVSHSAPVVVPLPVGSPGDLLNAELAVTLEQEGSSPSGRPTGPVIYAGRLAPTANR